MTPQIVKWPSNNYHEEIIGNNIVKLSIDKLTLFFFSKNRVGYKVKKANNKKTVIKAHEQILFQL